MKYPEKNKYRRGVRTETDIPTPVTRVYTNGDFYCQIHNDRIDKAVCTVRNIREPHKCTGCPHEAR